MHKKEFIENIGKKEKQEEVTQREKMNWIF